VAESAGSPAFAAEAHEVTRWCALLRGHGIEADERRLELEVDHEPLLRDGYAIVHPGAASRARRWPAARFAAGTPPLRREGLHVVLTGSPEERPLAQAIAAESGVAQSAVWAGRTDLAQLATLARDAALVVCGNTGMAHLATATRTPSVVLFGPESPARWGPPAEPAIH